MGSLVSIALATYNGEKYLSAFLDSVYNQTYQNIEVVAVDDCSNDNTLKVLERFAKKKDLRYYKNETNIGFVKNFEKALSLCKGEYIALADQDDIWFPEKIEVLLKNIGDKLLIHSDAIITKENIQISDSFTRYSKKQVQITDVQRLMFYNSVTGCTALFHNSLLKIALPFPDNIPYHDWWLAICAAKSSGIKYLDKPLTFYRQSNNISGGAEIMSIKSLIFGSLTKGFFKDRIDKNQKMLDWFLELRRSGLFDEKRSVIDDMIRFHQSFFEKKIRFRAIFLFNKYFRLMYPHYRFFTKIMILFTSLIGFPKKTDHC
jgi:glycosyltransferase involved in cell wall biosynthesis